MWIGDIGYLGTVGGSFLCRILSERSDTVHGSCTLRIACRSLQSARLHSGGTPWRDALLHDSNQDPGQHGSTEGQDPQPDHDELPNSLRTESFSTATSSWTVNIKSKERHRLAVNKRFVWEHPPPTPLLLQYLSVVFRGRQARLTPG